jgi:hypothetical protein
MIGSTSVTPSASNAPSIANEFAIIDFSALASANLDSSLKKRISIFVLAMRQGDPFSDAVLSAAEHAAILSPGLFSGESSECRASLFIAGRNVLVYLSGGNPFYLVQGVNYLAGLYLPSKKIYIRCSGQIDIIDFVCRLNSEVERLSLPACIPAKGRFLGVLVNCLSRPYHFFYDYLGALSVSLQVQGIDEAIPRYIYPAGQMFYDVNRIFNTNKPMIFLDSADQKFNDEIFAIGGYLIQPAHAMGIKNVPSNLDRRIVDLSIKDYSDSYLLNELKQCFPILWFGICGEKRAWLEQLDAIEKITKKLSNVYPKLAIIIDGITSPLNSNRSSLAAKLKKDFELYGELMARLPSSLKVLSLIGETADVKIAAATKVDGFLTSSLTDSMYVARYCKKWGVSHHSNRAVPQQHIHPNTLFVPQQMVKDLAEDSDKRWDKVDYSINPDLVASLFIDRLSTSLGGGIPSSKWSFSIKGRGAFSVYESHDGYVMDVDCSEKPLYVALNEKNYNFEFCGENPWEVQGHVANFLRFVGEPIGDIKVTLAVIAHGNSGRTDTHYLKPREATYVSFSEDTNSFRLFLRFIGRGQFIFKDVQVEKVLLSAF